MRLLIVIGACALATMASAQVRGRPNISVPLPEGRMMLIGGGPAVTSFIGLDEVRRSGRRIEAVILTLHDPGLAVGDKLATQAANRVEIDCDRRTSTEIGASAYDAQGAELVSRPAGDPVPLGEGLYGAVAQSLCGGMAGRPGYIVQGRTAAAKTAKDYREAAKAAGPQS